MERAELAHWFGQMSIPGIDNQHAHGVGALYVARSLQGLSHRPCQRADRRRAHRPPAAGKPTGGAGHQQLLQSGLGPGRADLERPDPVRPGSNPPDLVGAARGVRRLHVMVPTIAEPGTRRAGSWARYGRRSPCRPMPGPLRRGRSVLGG